MKMTNRILSLTLSVVLALSISLTVAAQTGQNSSTYMDFPQFRGSTMSAGIVDSKTPTTASDIQEKWKAAFGNGWTSSSGTPIIVGDYMYVLSSKNKALERISLENGQTAASTPCPGANQFFSTIGYGDGKIFVPRQSGQQAVIYAYDEQTMEMLWISEPIGDPAASIQPLSPVIYYNGHIYVGASNGQASLGAFACFTTKDDDSSKTDEVKNAVWQYKPDDSKSGYYWSSGAIAGNTIVFAGEASELVLHSLTNDTVYDQYNLGHAGVRSNTCYDADTRRVYVTTKDGYLCSIKINSNNTFDKGSYLEIKLGNDLTSSPVVFKGRVYVGGGGISSAAGFSVLNAGTFELIYQINTLKTQASPILTTAYATAENNWEVQLYVTDYERPSGLWMITDKQGQTEGICTKLIDPSETQYCTQSVTIDKNGSIYYFNDSGKMFAFSHKNAQTGAYTAQDVVNAIKLAESNGRITLNDEFSLNRIQARYNSLDTAERAKVSNYDKLTAMTAQIEALKNEANTVAELNKALENLVISNVTLEDEADISAQFERYNSLSEEGKKMVQKADILMQAVDKIQEIKDNNMVHTLEEKIAALPSVDEVVYDDKAKVEEVVTLLKNQDNIVQAKIDKTKLDALVSKLTTIEADIKDLNQQIFDKIDPMNITLADKETIEKLLTAYQALNEKNRKHITYYDDLVFAQKVITGLEQNLVIPEVFEYLAGSDKDYIIPGKTDTGKEYKITFNGIDITDPSIAFNTEISFDCANKDKIKALDENAVIVSFKHTGTLPGKAAVELAVDLADGKYKLYYFNAQTGKAECAGDATVANGKTVFTVTQGADYFISAKENLSNGNNGNTGNTPNTGDNGNLLAAFIILILSAGVMVAFRKRKTVQ